MSEAYTGPERRVRTLEDAEREWSRRLDEHENRELEAIHELGEEIKRAFPDGIENHRAAHQAMIDAAKAEEKFWTELKLDLAKKGLWAIFTILAGLVVLGLGAKVGLGAATLIQK